MRQDPASKAYLPVTVYARLKPGVTIAQAQSDLDGVESRRDIRNSGWKARVWSLRESMIRDLRLSLLVLLGAVALVLLDRVRERRQPAAGAVERAAAGGRDPRRAWARRAAACSASS